MRTSRALRLTVPAVAAIALAVLPSPTAHAQSLEKLKKEEAAAKQAADRAAVAVTNSIGEYNRVFHEIEKTKAAIAERQGRADRIGSVAKERAIEAYMGSKFEVADVFESADLLEASRKARLLGEVTKKDSETIDRLEVEAVDLGTAKERLNDLLGEAQRIIDAKRAAERVLEQKFTQLTAKRKALEARLAAQRSSGRLPRRRYCAGPPDGLRAPCASR